MTAASDNSPRNDAPIQGEFTITPEEYIDVVVWQRLHSPVARASLADSRRRTSKRLIVAAALTALAIVGFFLTTGVRSFQTAGAITMLLAGPGAFLAWVYAIGLMLDLRREKIASRIREDETVAARRAAELRCQFRIDAEGLTRDGDDIRTLIRWRRIACIFESDLNLILRESQGEYLFAPKRVLVQAEPWGETMARIGRWMIAGGGGTGDRVGESLRDRDFLCPECRYNLRGARLPMCPECGFQLDPAMLPEPLESPRAEAGTASP